MKVAHEAPLCMFEDIQRHTDYDYALVHLFEESPEYLEKFREAKKKGREIILDNSIFELNEAFDMVKFDRWVKDLQPTWYIVPDVLEDCQGTIDNFEVWKFKNFGHPDSKSIGVVQGKTYEELVECYRYMAENADMIAISFDYSFFEEVFPDEETKYHKWVKGRQWLVQKLEDDGVIQQDIPHHLLGTGLPQEFAYYRHKKYIYSCDTSNPVVHGMFGERYQRQPEYDIYGLNNKLSVKLFELINSEVSPENFDDILYNVEYFKRNMYV